MKGGQERAVTTRIILLTTSWSLPQWMKTNKLTNQLSWQAGCSSRLSWSTPHLYQQSITVHFRSSDLDTWEGPCPPPGLFEHLSSVVSTFFPSCISHPISLSQFLSPCSFLLALFCSVSKLSKLLIWDLTFPALSFQTGACFYFQLQYSNEYHRIVLLKSY